MTKTFKKVIACLLAVLMACFSVPFTALATPDSYQPNLSMRFGTFSNSASSKDFTGTTTSSTLLKTGNDFSLSGIYTPQVDWEGTLNKENGSVNITKLYFDTSRLEAFMPSYDEEMTIDDYDGDLGEDTNGIIEYEEGMPFTLTFTLQNIKKIIGYGAFFTYTDNIAPAIVYQSGTKSSNLVTKLGTINDYNNDTTSKKAAVTPVNCAIEAQSSESFYEDTSGEPWECWKDVVNEGDGLFEFIGSSPYDADISTCNLVSEQEDIVDPVTNELGYDCANDAICVTFIFLVTGEISEEHPLTIGFQDYTSASAKNGSISCASDDTQLYDIDHCTYGPQEGATGSCHAYFMGYNANTGAYVDDGSYYNSYPWTDKDETPTEHTHTYGEYTHDENAETHSAYCTSGDGGKDTQDCEFELDTDSSSSATCTENGKNVYKCTVCGYSYEEELTATGHSFTKYEENDDAVAATCTEDGKTASKTAKCDNNCGEEDTVAGETITATGHKFTNYVENDDAVAATCSKDGKTASKTAKCDNNCGTEDTIDGETITATGVHSYVEIARQEATEDAAGYVTYQCESGGETYDEVLPIKDHTHTYTETVVAATCTEDGYTLHTCVKGDDSYKTDVTPATGHSFTNYVSNNDGKAATCTEDGVTDSKTAECDNGCGEKDTVAGTKIDKTGHSFTKYEENNDAVAATCTTDGKTASKTAKCDNNCGEEDTVEGTKIDATGHSFTNYVSNNDAVEATKKEAGKTASKTAKCDNNCGEEDTVAGEVIPALGYTITVLNTNGEASSDNYCDLNVQWGDNTANFGDKFTIDASAIEGGKVVGYKVNGRFVAGSTYSVTVSSDMTVQVITEDTSANVATITATFLDMYNNVIKTVAGTVDEVRAELATVPTAPTYPGYTFVDWSITDDEIKNISESTTITANYEANATVGYTVTTSAELTLPEGVENGSIPYDSSVTVTDANATSWTVDGVTVAYGDTYTFFVGSDVTVQPAYDAVVTSGAATSIISKTLNADGVKVVFLATMDVADGYTLVDHGFIYGKNATDAELTLDNVGSAIAANSDAKVKATHAGATGSLQFGLNYGLSAKTGTANVKAYVIVKNSAGTLITIESAANGYTY
jgi:rubredoxin